MNPQQPSQPRGGLLGLFDKATKTNEDTGLSPLQNFAAALDPLILKDLRGGEGIRQQGVQRAAAMSKNKTVDMLRAQGRDDLADAVMNGTIAAKEAFSVMQSEKAADLAFKRQQMLAGGRAKDTALMRRAVAAGLEPGTEDYKKFMLTGGSAYAPGAPVEFGTLDKGTMMVQGRDEQGNITYQVMPIPGSQAAADVERAAAAKDAAREGGIKTAGVVLTNIDEAQRIIAESKLPTSGFTGSMLKKIPGTAATDVGALVNTIKANIGFDKLQAMRDASPTGGALGQVSNQEIDFLQSTLNNLNQEQSQEQFNRQLQILENQYLQTIAKFNAYPEEAKAAAGYTDIGTSSPAGTQGSSAAPDFTKMSKEEIEAWIAANGG
jgi:hypothetical protein